MDRDLGGRARQRSKAKSTTSTETLYSFIQTRLVAVVMLERFLVPATCPPPLAPLSTAWALHELPDQLFDLSPPRGKRCQTNMFFWLQLHVGAGSSVIVLVALNLIARMAIFCRQDWPVRLHDESAHPADHGLRAGHSCCASTASQRTARIRRPVGVLQVLRVQPRIRS